MRPRNMGMPPGGPIITGEDVAARFSLAVAQAFPSLSAAARAMDIRRETLRAWCDGSQSARTASILLVAHHCGTTPGALLGGYQTPEAWEQFMEGREDLPPAIRETLHSMAWQGIEPSPELYAELLAVLRLYYRRQEGAGGE